MREAFIQDGSAIPVPEAKRSHTDVICTIIGALFALTLFVLACIFYSSSSINTNYFTYTVTAGTLAPTSSDFEGFRIALWCTIVTALGLGLIWTTWVHFFPRISPHTAHVLAILTLIAVGVLTLVGGSNFFNNNGGWKIIVAVFCFVLALIIFFMFWFYSNELRIQGIFLDYSRRFLHEATGTFLYIPLFLLLLAGFFALFLFQHVAFSSKGTKNNNYWDFSNPGFLGILNILEFIWGFQFLRDAFNFCVSGRATYWYWNNPEGKCHTPLQKLITHHWGSVVGGSFLNAFFEIPTLLVELVTCHSTTCCAKIGKSCEERCCWGHFFNLVRTDAYSYITLSGLPFCNSARQCHELCFRGEQFVAGYNPLKHYRFAASVFLTTISYLLAHIYANKRVDYFTWWHFITLVVLSYAVICWFVNIDADAAEGIATSFLAEYNISSGYDAMTLAQHPFKQDIKDRSNRDANIKDGHC